MCVWKMGCRNTCVGYESNMCATWAKTIERDRDKWDAKIHVWHDTFICEAWHTHVCMTWALVFASFPASRHTFMSHVTHSWVTSHIHEARHTFMRHVTHSWVTSHIHESCHTFMSHVTPSWVTSLIHESRHTSWVTDTFICKTWHTHVCMIWALVCVTWLVRVFGIHMCA